MGNGGAEQHGAAVVSSCGGIVGVDSAGAAIFAERVRAEIANTPFLHSEHQPLGQVTVSVGVSSFPGDGKTAAEVLKAADSAVYLSKQAGRNRVTLYKNTDIAD